MNKIEIEIPNGKEIDWEASAEQERIVFRDKQLTYKDVCQKLFRNGYCFIDGFGQIATNGKNEKYRIHPSNAKTSHQLECILNKNKLANTAVYLNNGWKPNLDRDGGYCIVIDPYENLRIDSCAVLCSYSLGKVMFKTAELAQQAIEILGEETIKLALEPLY
jgi:hypothetical protein